MTEPVESEATEAIDGGSPAFVHPRGTILLVISAHKAHANFTVTPSAKEAFAAELEGLETGKGSVKLPYEVSSLAHGIRSGRGIGRPRRDMQEPPGETPGGSCVRPSAVTQLLRTRITSRGGC